MTSIYAHPYIDDRNLFGFPGWLQAVEEVERVANEFKVQSLKFKEPVTK